MGSDETREKLRVLLGWVDGALAHTFFGMSPGENHAYQALKKELEPEKTQGFGECSICAKEIIELQPWWIKKDGGSWLPVHARCANMAMNEPQLEATVEIHKGSLPLA